MGKFATKKMSIDLSLGNFEELFFLALKDKKSIKVIEKSKVAEKHIILMKTFGHPKSYGEFITIEYYEVDNSHTSLLIKSELCGNIEVTDFDVNLKNITVIVELIKNAYYGMKNTETVVKNSEKNGMVLASSIEDIKTRLFRNLNGKKRYKILEAIEQNNYCKVRVKKLGRMGSLGEIITVELTEMDNEQTHFVENTVNIAKFKNDGLVANNKNSYQFLRMCTIVPGAAAIRAVEIRPIDKRPVILEASETNQPFNIIKALRIELAKENDSKPTTQTALALVKNIPCIYCGGHEKLDKETSGFLSVFTDRIEFTVIRKKFEIPIKMIVNNEIMSHEQITQRITATRMVLLGVFALAAPQKNKNTSNYITIQYVDRGVNSTIVFKGDDGGFTSSKNQIIKINNAILKARKAQ